MKEYVCTKCGWIGTNPKPFPNVNVKGFVCPQCPYMVLEVKSTEEIV